MDTTYFIPLLIIAIVVLSIGGVIVFLYNRRRKGLVSLNLKVLSIRIPRHEKSETKDFASEINLSEQLFTALSSINTEFVFEISVKSVGEEICFYLAVPREALDFAKRTVQGLFLEAKVEEAPDYTIFQPQGASTAGYLALAKPYLLPITTYRESEADVFSPIISTLSRLDNLEEGATLQFIVRPTGEHFKKDAMEILSRLKKGEKFKDLTDKSLVSFDKIEKAILTQPKKDEADNTPKVLDEEMIKSVGMKLAKPLFSINVRIITASTNHNKAEDSFLSISSSFSKFASPTRNSFKIVKPKNHKKLIFNYIFREFDESQKMILNAEELASIFHLPTTTSDVPNISWLRSKEAPAPEFLPTTGLFLGESIFRDNKKEIRLTDDDRRRHMYLVGQTGTGKSVLLQNMAMQDMINGKGLCVIDPHGELIEKLLAFVPKERIDDVIVLDPGDMERPLGLNMLEFDETKPEEKTFIINELQAIFNQLFQKETMGPMFEKYMRNSLLLLMEDAKNEPATITEIARIFSDEDFRKRKLARCNNTSVIDFWTKEVPKVTGEAGLGNMAPYITSKFDNFISNDYIRPMIGQVKSAFNFREAMDNGKILLVNLSKGKVGDINSSLIGMIIVGKILQAALSRVYLEEKDRRDFYLYIDEFQNYTTDSIASILSEARKYRLSLTVAHQYIAQLKDNIRESIFGNVGNLVSFRVGPPDADTLVKHFSPTFNEKDLISIENLNAYVKLLINGEPTLPFNMKITWAEGGSSVVRDSLKELSSLKYGQDRQTVESEITARLRN